MMKTLVVTLDYLPRTGGAARYVSELCARLDARNLCVLTTPNPHAVAIDRTVAHPIERRTLLSSKPFLWPRWLPMLLRTFQAVRRTNSDLILAGEILPGGTIAWLCSRLLKKRYGLFVHGLDILGPQARAHGRSLAGSRRTWLIRRILRSASVTIVNSSFTQKEVEKLGADPSRVHVVYPATTMSEQTEAVTPDRVLTRYHLQGKRIILSVGRLVARKGHDHVLQAVAGLAKEHPDVMYVIVGHGPERQRLVRLATEYGISDRVFFAGAVPDDELLEWYAACDVMCMPSRFVIQEGDVEGFGIVYLEASAFGKPVIGGNGGGVPEAIEDSVTGLIVDPDSVPDIRRALERILTDAPLASRLGSAGAQRVRERFIWDKQGEQFQSILEAL